MSSAAYKAISARVAQRLADFNSHELVLVADVPNVKVWLVRGKDGLIDSYEVAFLQSGICLAGDYVPGAYGAVSTRNYGEKWFASKLGYGYLAEKFLRKGWYPENASWWVQDQIAELQEEDRLKEAEELRDLSKSDDFYDDESSFRDAVCRVIKHHEWSDSSPHDYDPHDLVALSVCQQVFARLWHEKQVR
jgi:hypothetical protein